MNMSFLTPLYIAGLLAVSLPVLFHLIRRAPRGRLAFSSLMFLSPSPPRLTRRSRLDNLLLLLLRVSVLVLLALAFARPFWRLSAQLGFDRLAGRRVAVLLDTSASMRRAGLWEQALDEVGQVLDDLGPGDDAALFTFDAEVVEQVGFHGAVRLDPRTHAASLRARLATLAPTWARSNLGVALIAAAEELHELDGAGSTGAETLRQVVLVSDFQEGSRIDDLQAYTWPDDVHLELRRVAPAEMTNAALVPAGAADPLEHDRDPHVRVRVANDPHSTVERFQLRWEGGLGDPSADEAIGVYVPPGESRVVRVPRPSQYAAKERLVLSGDAHAFDNTLYLVPTRQEEVPLLYVGSDRADDAQGLRYYLQRALPETPERKVRLTARAPDEPLASDELLETRLVVVGEAVPDQQAAQLNQYLDGRGVPSIEESLKEIILQPVHYPFRELTGAGMLTRILAERGFDAHGQLDQDLLGEVEQKSLHLLLEINKIAGGEVNERTIGELAQQIRNKVEAILLLPQLSIPASQSKSRNFKSGVKLALADLSESKPDLINWCILLGWAFTHNLGRLMGETGAEQRSQAWIDEWLLGRILASSFIDLGMNEQDAWDAVSTIKILIRHDKWYEIGPPKSTRSFRILEGLLADMFVQGYLQVNRYQEILWFNQERYHDLLAWLARSASINGIDQWGLMAENLLYQFMRQK